MEDSLVVEDGMLVKFSLVPLAICLLHLQLLFQGSFHQEEVKQPHCRDTKKTKNHEFMRPPEAQDHLQLAPFPFLQEQYNNCGTNFFKKNSLSKHMLVLQSQLFLKILQDGYLFKL